MPRPGSSILIVGSGEDEVGVWRFLLRNSHPKANVGLYKVHSANNVPDAIDMLQSIPLELVMLLEPFDDIQAVIDHALQHSPITRSLVLTTTASHNSRYVADSFLTVPSATEFRERLSVLMARKRGPRPGSHHRKPPESESIQSKEAVIA